jgi:hypothetical protein
MFCMPYRRHLERVSGWYDTLHYMGLSESCTHVYSQVFCPAKVVFAGVGVLLLVRILTLDPQRDNLDVETSGS